MMSRLKSVISLILIVGLLFSSSIKVDGYEAPTLSLEGDYKEAERSCYEEFILPVYPQGLSTNWRGIFSTYLPNHKDDKTIEGENKNHNVSIHSINLLGHYLLLIGDQAKFDELFKLWAPSNLGGGKFGFVSLEFQMTHWLLDSDGRKVPGSDISGDKVYICSTAEQLEIINNLYLAHQRFTLGKKNSKYERLAKYLADGLKGVSKGLPEGEALFSDKYALRPLFKWHINPPKPVEPLADFSNIEANSLETYYYITHWLKDPYYENVLENAIKFIELGQSELGLFRTRLDLKKYDFDLRDINNLRCSSLAGLKLSLDLVKYSKLSGDKKTELLARRYLDFMIKKYTEDGRIYNSYFVDTGAPFSMFESLPVYARLARLAIEFGEYGFAKRILEKKILPRQVKKTELLKNQDVYLGAFKEEGGIQEANNYIRKDAWAFHNLEVLFALNKWNSRQNIPFEPYQSIVSDTSTPQLITLPLVGYVNNDGITDGNNSDGDLDGYGWAFYGGDLPESNTILKSINGGIEFLFPDKRLGRNNNIECLGQEISLSPDKYSNIHLLAVAHNGNFEDKLQLIYEDGIIEISDLKLGDWWNEPLFGQVAVKGRCVNKGKLQEHEVYLAHIKLATDPKKNLQAIKLPQLDNMHIFGITLEKPSGEVIREARPDIFDSEVNIETAKPLQKDNIQFAGDVIEKLSGEISKEAHLDSAAEKLIQTILDYQMENGLTSYKAKEKIGGDYSWGLFILSMIAAHQNGYISRELALERITRMLKTIERLPKYHGWLYKYYDLYTEQPASKEVGFQGWYLFSLIVAKEVYPELAPLCEKLLKVDYSINYNMIECFLFGDYDTEQKKCLYPIPLGPHKGRKDKGFAASERRIAYVVYTYLTGDKNPWYLNSEPSFQIVEGHEFLEVWKNFNFDIAHLHYALPEVGYYEKSWYNFVEASKKFMEKNSLEFLPMREGLLEDLRDNRGYPNTEHREATPALTWYINRDALVMEKAFTPGHGMWRYYDNCLFYWSYGRSPVINGYIGNLPKDSESRDMIQVFSFNIDKDIKVAIPPKLKSVSVMTSIPQKDRPPYGNLSIWLNGRKITQISPSEVTDLPRVIKRDVDIELKGGKNVLVFKNDNSTRSENNIYYIYRYENNLLNTEYGYEKIQFNLVEDVFGEQYTTKKVWIGENKYCGSIVNVVWEGQKSGPEVEDTCTAFLVRCAVIHGYYVYENLLKVPKFLDSFVAWVGDYYNEVSIARTIYNVSEKGVTVSYQRPTEWSNPSYIKVKDITKGEEVTGSITLKNEKISWLALSHHAYSIEYEVNK